MKSSIKTLREIFENHSGRLLHKWDHYIEIYDKHFSSYRNKKINILEIGISHGGSLEMWRKYFGVEATIYAIDINPECEKFRDVGIEIFIGSQEDSVFLKKIFDILPPIDILIDDGGHTMNQQVTTFNILFNKVKDNGLYLVEDVHTSYWKHWGGGFRKKASFIEFSKNLIESLYAWHIDDTKLIPVDNYTKTINCITYYDSIIVFEKKPRSEPFHLMKGAGTIQEKEQPLKRVSAFKKWKRKLFPKKQNSFERQFKK
jgi:hypothetical protein